MPGRTYSSASYRYGFNGKENDNEVKVTCNFIDYGFRIRDPRLGGGWLSVDPLQKKYPNESPYVFVSNNPILYKDADGRDKYFSIFIKTDNGTYPLLQVQTDKGVYKYNPVNYWSKEAAFKVAYTKNDEYLNLTIDLSSKANLSNLFKLTTSEKIVGELTTSGYVLEKAGTLLSKKFGFALQGGNSKTYEITNEEASITESLDVSRLMKYGSGLRGIPGLKDFPGFTTALGELGPKAKLVLGALQLADRMDNLQSGMDALGVLDAEKDQKLFNQQNNASPPAKPSSNKPFASIKPNATFYVPGDPPGQNRTKETDSTAGCCDFRPATDTLKK